jgi:hypothetical protein
MICHTYLSPYKFFLFFYIIKRIFILLFAFFNYNCWIFSWYIAAFLHILMYLRIWFIYRILLSFNRLSFIKILLLKIWLSFWISKMLHLINMFNFIIISHYNILMKTNIRNIILILDIAALNIITISIIRVAFLKLNVNII